MDKGADMAAVTILPLVPGEEELLLSPGYAHVEEPLLLRQLPLLLGMEARKGTLLQSRQKYVIKFAALGLMYGDDGNLGPLVQSFQLRIGKGGVLEES